MMHPALQATLGGVLIGLASWLLLASIGRVAGISGIAASALVPDRAAPVAQNYWRWAFLVGLILGGTLFALFWSVPQVSQRPLLLLVLAGALVGVGTVLGSGCTSGHGVCGLGRRSARSLVATLSFMGFGFATVFIFNAVMGRLPL